VSLLHKFNQQYIAIRSLSFYQRMHVTCIYLPNFIQVEVPKRIYVISIFKMADMASQFLFRLRV